MTDGERSIRETGIAECDFAARVGDVHVLGVLHESPLAITRVTGAITRYKPDVVAIEASEEAISQYHPDVQDARWPPRDELEAAAYITDRDYDLLLAGIDTSEYTIPDEFEALDREIFVELGILDETESLTRSTYYELDIPLIRRWRAETEQRAPELFKEVIADRDESMAGHLHAMASNDDIDTVVAAVGVQHLTGVIDLLSDPSTISEEYIECPPLADYRLFPRDSPYSSYSDG
jgi:hypothetical protein